MVKRLALLAALTLCSLAAHAQGSQYKSEARNAFGRAIPFANIRVCGPTALGVPCNVLLPIWTDYTKTSVQSQPGLKADSAGNFSFGCNPGIMIIQITSLGFGPYTYTDSCPAVNPATGVTSFSAGNAAPLFTTSVATGTTTPSLNFTLSPFAAHTFYGNCTGVTATPTNCALTAADLPAIANAIVSGPSVAQTVTQPANTDFTVTTSGTGSLMANVFWRKKFLWLPGDVLNDINTKCVTAGGGNIYAVGNVSAGSQVFGQISTHTICNLIITTGSKATLSSVDASGMGWCWANGGGIYGENHGHGNGFTPNASMLDVAGGVNPVWGFTNCRHSGDDQSFTVADIIFIHQSGTVGSAPWVLFENNGMFSGTSMQDVLFYSGNNAMTNVTWVSDTNPIPSTATVSVVTLASNGAGVCTVTTRTPSSAPGTATPPYTHFVWMAPLNGGEGYAAKVTIAGAVEAGFNLTKTSVTGISDSNHFTYACPGAAPNTTATGTISYNVYDSDGTNNVAINTEHLYKHVNGGTGTSPGARPFLVWAIGSTGACGATGGLYFDGFEADNSIGAADFELKSYNSLTPYGDICGNGSNVFRNVNLSNGHFENGGVAGYAIKAQDCKSCIWKGLSGSGGTGSTFLDVGSSGGVGNIAGWQIDGFVAGTHLNLLVDHFNSKTFAVVNFASMNHWDAYGFEDSAGNKVKFPVLFASLPACSATYAGGDRAISDSTTTTWGATITGGGGNTVRAFCNGTNWTVVGK